MPQDLNDSASFGQTASRIVVVSDRQGAILLITHKEFRMRATGLSLLLIVVGAILAFAVSTTVAGVSTPMIGLVLMLLGMLGVLSSPIFLVSFSPFSSASPQVKHVDRVDGHQSN